MDGNQKPSLQEWMRDNPGSGVNEYFAKYGDTGQTPFSQPIIQQPIITQVPKQRRRRPFEWFTILISLGMIYAFFQPWIQVVLFEVEDKLTATGMEIPTDYASWEAGFVLVPDKMQGHYLILAGAVMALLGALLRWYWLKFFGAALSVMLVARWIIVLVVWAGSEQFIETEQDMWSFIEVGTYAAVGCAGLYLIDFIKEWF